MLNAKTFALLKKVIATIPHDNRRAFRESDLILGLVENLPVLFPDQDADDLGMWTRIAKAIVKEAMDDEAPLPLECFISPASTLSIPA